MKHKINLNMINYPIQTQPFDFHSEPISKLAMLLLY